MSCACPTLSEENACNAIVTEKILNGCHYQRHTGLIYNYNFTKIIGSNIKGKIKWRKKKDIEHIQALGFDDPNSTPGGIILRIS